MEYWELNIDPAGNYYLWLCKDMPKDKTIIVNISNEAANDIIEKTGCKVNEIPF